MEHNSDVTNIKEFYIYLGAYSSNGERLKCPSTLFIKFILDFIFIEQMWLINPVLSRIKQLRAANRRAKLTGSIVMVSLLSAGLVLSLQRLGWLQSLELIAYDYLVSAQPQEEPDPRLLIVGISESDIQNLQQWPVSDQILADALKVLQSHQPKTIGVDIWRDIPQEPGHGALIEQFQSPNVIAIETFGVVPPPPSIDIDQVGFNDLVIDPDGSVRRNLLFSTVDGQTYYSFALRLSLAYLGDRAQPVTYDRNALTLGTTSFPILKPNAGAYHNIDNTGYQVLTRYRNADSVARQITLTDVLEGNFQPDWVNGKIILIGATAPSAKDNFFTPQTRFNRKKAAVPGVTLHGYLVSQILSTVLDGQPLLWAFPEWAEIFGLVMIAGAGATLAWRLKHPIILLVSGIGISLGIIGIGYGVALRAGWVPVVAPLLGFTTSVGLSMSYRRLYDSTHDALTGFLNREQFLEKIASSIVRRSPLNSRIAVFVLRLNRLSIINESLGFEAVDTILQMVAERLHSALPSHTPISRIGTDQFAILLDPIIASKNAIIVADKITYELKQPFLLRGKPIFLDNNIGIALTQPNYKYQPAELLRDAHIAMHRAKIQGTSRHEMFANGMREEKLLRMQLEIDLRLALERQEFFLNYQPLVCLETGRIGGFEALVRWQHPTQGLISPADFIPVAEETGLIVPLGQWIIETACRQLSDWHKQFSDVPLIMSINLSPGQFAQPDLVEKMQTVLVSSKLAGQFIKLEITESMFMDNLEAAISLLWRLKKLGLKLGIDDFGTGYSSLSYLSRLPADTVKIDRSFVENMDVIGQNKEIVRAIVTLGHSLNMSIIAEGVETAEQLNLLRELHCEYAQGFFMSRPLMGDKATLLLEQNPRWQV